MSFFKNVWLKRAFLGAALFLMVSFFSTTGCTPLWVGAGVAGGYMIASDERSVGQWIDDSVITSNVKSKLLAHSKVKGLKIDVDTIEGEVTLTGIVGSKEEADIAIELARGVQGVVKVKDNLKVRD
ncbi:BON domain-containing protein [bacterium]|nr:BON domain-containing protein [bacterium]